MNFMTCTPALPRLPGLAPACLALLGLSAVAAAQDTRSTLARLMKDSTCVAQARVLNVRVDGSVRRVTFKTRQSIKGNAPSVFALTEPHRRSCGSALYGTLVGTSYIAFLTGEGQSLRLAVGSARALIPLGPATLAHIRSLATFKTSAQRLALAVEGLSSTSARIRRDAAASLARAKELDSLPHALRWQCLQKLGQAIGHEDCVALDLLQVARRLRLKSAVDILVPQYLARRSGRLEAVLLETISKLDPDRAVRSLEAAMPSDVRGIQRGIVLLGHCQGQAAHRCLERLTEHGNHAVATMAREVHRETSVDPDARVITRNPTFRSILQSKRR